MTEDKERYLLENFPHLYRKFYDSAQTTCMCWGFSHDDGWFELIKRLSEKIMKYLDLKKRAGETWFYDNFTVSQVKEKFGTLKYYVDGGDDIISDLITLAEGHSALTCELCGHFGNGKNPVKIRGSAWLSTRCDSCYEKKKELSQ